MIRGKGDLFKDAVVDKIIMEAIKDEIKEFAKKIQDKYVPKLKEIQKIKDDQVGFRIFEIEHLIWDYVLQDPDLKQARYRVNNMPLMTRKMVKQVFKDCFNEILDEETNIIVNGKPKTKKSLLAEKIYNGVMNDTLDPVTLKGFEVIRDTIGEKPANEVISKGIQQKVIDIKVTQEKVEKVQNILESLRSAKIGDGLKQDFSLRAIDARPRDERDTETDVSGESEGVYNADVLPDKQD